MPRITCIHTGIAATNRTFVTASIPASRLVLGTSLFAEQNRFTAIRRVFITIVMVRNAFANTGITIHLVCTYGIRIAAVIAVCHQIGTRAILEQSQAIGAFNHAITILAGLAALAGIAARTTETADIATVARARIPKGNTVDLIAITFVYERKVSQNPSLCASEPSGKR